MAGGLVSIGFVFFSAVKWYWVIRGFLGMRTKSLFPLLGGFLGFLVFSLSDVPGAVRLCWIPLLLDPGSALLVCGGLYYHFGVSSWLAACYRTIPGNRLTQGETLLRALETRLFPYIESLGFVRDKRYEPRIVCFRRRTEITMQIVAVIQPPRGRPGFSIEFTEVPLSGIDYEWMHLPAEDIFPGNFALLRGWLIPERGKMWFRPASPWQRLFSKKRVDADGIVQRSMELFPEIIAWWESKAKGTHLIVFQPVPLQAVPSHAPVFGQPVVPTLLQNIFARNGVWVASFFGIAVVFTLVMAIQASGLGEMFGLVVAGAAPGAMISWISLKILLHVRIWINGGPFRKGELVQVIAGPYAGRIAAVYDEWPSINKVRIDLGESEWKERKDVFSHIQLCRVKPLEPEK
jgi:hypothetical protein